MNSRRAEWLYSPWSTVLLVATLLTSLVLGTAFLVINNRSVDASGSRDGLTDTQATAVVIGSAKRIVKVAQLREVTVATRSCRAKMRASHRIKRL